MTTALATGSVLPELVSNFGATRPTALQSTTGSGGMFVISGLKLSCASLTKSRDGLYVVIMNLHGFDNPIKHSSAAAI